MLQTRYNDQHQDTMMEAALPTKQRGYHFSVPKKAMSADDEYALMYQASGWHMCS